MSQPHLLVEREGAVAVVTMNRPEARNAFGPEMLVRMADAWDELDGDPSVRVVIFTGAGGHFCAGSDLKFMAGKQEPDEWVTKLRATPDLHWKSLLRHYRLKKPLIAAVEGTALAGGTEILQATDIRVAGAGAKFGVAEAKLGLFPLAGSTVRLQRQIPYTIAMELLLTGRHITAEEALRIGLIGRVVPAGEALGAAKGIAAEIAANGPIAVQAIKRSVIETADMSEADGLKRELEIGWPVFGSEDAKEGPRAFAEKRKPEFKGK
jgi:enoyl-CoA hydratase